MYFPQLSLRKQDPTFNAPANETGCGHRVRKKGHTTLKRPWVVKASTEQDPEGFPLLMFLECIRHRNEDLQQCSLGRLHPCQRFKNLTLSWTTAAETSEEATAAW